MGKHQGCGKRSRRICICVRLNQEEPEISFDPAARAAAGQAYLEHGRKGLCRRSAQQLVKRYRYRKKDPAGRLNLFIPLEKPQSVQPRGFVFLRICGRDLRPSV